MCAFIILQHSLKDFLSFPRDPNLSVHSLWMNAKADRAIISKIFIYERFSHFFRGAAKIEFMILLWRHVDLKLPTQRRR